MVILYVLKGDYSKNQYSKLLISWCIAKLVVRFYLLGKIFC